MVVHGDLDHDRYTNRYVLGRSDDSPRSPAVNGGGPVVRVGGRLTVCHFSLVVSFVAPFVRVASCPLMMIVIPYDPHHQTHMGRHSHCNSHHDD